MAEDFNSVPLGQAGTGSAFVLGGSNAAKRYVDTIDYNNEIDKRNRLLKQQQAQQIANDWQRNALKVDGGLYWQNEFNKRNQDHIQKGIQLRQMGVNPFNYNPNNPNEVALAEDYLLERQGILNDVKDRTEREAELKKSFDLVRKNPTGYYNSDIQALNNIVGGSYADAKNTPTPTLEERFDPNKLLSTITPAQIGNEVVLGNKKIKSVKALPNETREAIVASYQNTPATQRWVDELTGGQGFTIQSLEQIPNTKQGIAESLDAQYRGNPEFRTQLAQQGIVGMGSPKYKQFAEQEADRLFDAKNKWNKQIESDLSRVLPKVKEMSSVLPDYGEANQRRADRRLQLSEEANARAREKQSERGEDKPKDEAALYRQKTIDDMIGNVEGSGERLKSVLSATGYYTESELNNMIGARGNYIEFRVPEKTIKYTNSDGNEVSKTLDKKTVLIDKRDANSKLKLNQLLNDLTGEKISESKVQTGQASGKVKGEVFTEKGAVENKSTVTMILPNGQSGEIPADKVDAFLKKYPKAKRQ